MEEFIRILNDDNRQALAGSVRTWVVSAFRPQRNYSRPARVGPSMCRRSAAIWASGLPPHRIRFVSRKTMQLHRDILRRSGGFSPDTPRPRPP